ncbi:TonB-dependent receptor plug domain-containing protein [Bacteroides sp. UBA939]|uniref:TonB-dependent receptor plug domain-containing protein n=1 Tax=Bacteroides sp. UBA939 TaxID=1946092 RepID=UPI0025C56A5E|nr:TonB-dependent receptor [Bacteroides sp. UBA939]
MKRLILLLSMGALLTTQHLEAQTTVASTKAQTAVTGIEPQTAVTSTEPQPAPTDTIFLRIFNDSVDLYNDSVDLKEVVVKGKRTPVANSRWSDMHPIELVTVGGANGDLYQALQTLPGTQLQGESGRLLVRGGSSDESQTYIDGMHVLNPYTATAINSPARGRYSTFMFSGVNLESGGAPLEYGEALSAVLPLETKDKSPVNKLGINASTVGFGSGGTRAFDKGSLSVNLDYQDLCVYDRIYPGRTDFADPYRMMTASAQFRYHPDDATLFKIYFGYDRTDFSNYEGQERTNLSNHEEQMQTGFSNYEGQERRLFDLGENNFYLNTTFRKTTSKGWNWFAGAAYGFFEQKINNVSLSGDGWMERQQELHIKAKVFKRLSPTFRLDVGTESFIRQYENRYKYQPAGIAEASETPQTDNHNKMTPTITAAFLSATYYPVEQLKAELSLRTEYTSGNRQANLSPRLSVNYYLGSVVFSATAGRYTQLPVNRLLVQNESLKSEVCTQYNLGARFENGGRLYKAEIYYKDYNHLALIEKGTINLAEVVTSGGYGHSKGFDLFFNDRVLVKNLEYQLSYTYNVSKRKFRELTELTTPQYATRHNASVVLKYSIPRIGTIVGLTNRFSSGRPYHNPALPGLMNDEVKPYNSLDLGLTYLLSKKVIIHASATNILCRQNEFGKVDNKAILASEDHFFYVGVYITIGKKAAYDVSNF